MASARLPAPRPASDRAGARPGRAFCFAVYLVDAHLVSIAADAEVIFIGNGSVLPVSGFVLIGLHTFVALRALWAADYRQESIAHFKYLIGVACGVTGGFVLTGLASDIGSGIQAVLVTVAAFQNEIRAGPAYVFHLSGATISFVPTLYGLSDSKFTRSGLGRLNPRLLMVWKQNPRLGFQLQFRQPPE